MARSEITVLDFELGAPTYTLDDLCEICQLTVDRIGELVEYGVLNPAGESSAEWRFSAQSITQVRRAHRLRRDLELNLAGIALALELRDDNARLRRELQLARAQLARFMSLL